jgi:crotonobetainyl-CoA:carnitine CoA-transferase CaiB-like acyl-CoA transferase
VSSTEDPLAGIHSGLRVIDLAGNLAGPLAAMILGDLGADVVKVEHPQRGDDTRGLVPSFEGVGTVFLAVNRNKRSVGLDIRSEAGHAALMRLVQSADVVIESFGPGVGERLGITYETVRQVSPTAIYCSVSAFGEGPIGSQRPGYDTLIQGFSGMLSITGHPDGPPARVAPSSVDLSTGLWLVIAIQAALARRAQSGVGQQIDVALLDTAFNLMCHQVLGMLATGVPTPRLGTESPSSTPNGAYRAADGWIVVATANDRLFARLCEALELPHLAEDPRFATTAARIEARSELRAILAPTFASRSVADWSRRLSAARVPVGPLNDLQQALGDPLTEERGLLVDPPVDDAGRSQPGDPPEIAQLRLPIDRTGAWVRRPPPKLGEHTREVLSEAGLGVDAIAELLRAIIPS